MKRWILHRSLSVLLCVTLLLSLAACSGQDPQPEKDGTDSAAGVISGRKEEKDKPQPETNSEEGAASLALLRDGMTYSGQIAGAVAYLGHRERGDTTPLADWLRKHCSALAEELPFLLEIPAERTLEIGRAHV